MTTCKGCKWKTPCRGGGIACHRFPPTPMRCVNGNAWVYPPVTDLTPACGEYENLGRSQAKGGEVVSCSPEAVSRRMASALEKSPETRLSLSQWLRQVNRERKGRGKDPLRGVHYKAVCAHFAIPGEDNGAVTPTLPILEVLFLYAERLGVSPAWLLIGTARDVKP